MLQRAPKSSSNPKPPPLEGSDIRIVWAGTPYKLPALAMNLNGKPVRFMAEQKPSLTDAGILVYQPEPVWDPYPTPALEVRIERKTMAIEGGVRSPRLMLFFLEMIDRTGEIGALEEEQQLERGPIRLSR